MRNQFCCFVVTLSLAVIAENACHAGNVLLLARPTDTIMVSGQTFLANAATYEARVLFTDEYNTPLWGRVYNEWTPGYEDKLIGTGLGVVSGWSFYTSVSKQYWKSCKTTYWIIKTYN